MHEQPANLSFATQPAGFLSRVLGTLLSIALLGLAALFSVFALAVLALVGTLFAGWLWWRTRRLRRELQKMAETASAPQPAGEATDSLIIEGEWRREVNAAPAEPPRR